MSSTIFIKSSTTSTTAAKHSLAVTLVTVHNPFAASAIRLFDSIVFIHQFPFRSYFTQLTRGRCYEFPLRGTGSPHGRTPYGNHSNITKLYIFYQIKDTNALFYLILSFCIRLRPAGLAEEIGYESVINLCPPLLRVLLQSPPIRRRHSPVACIEVGHGRIE